MKKHELFMRTVTGVEFYPFAPRPSDINIYDIARGLSNMCRYSGQVSFFYSVAQHSILVSELCDPADALWGLMHDASEAYLSDVVRPLKSGLPEYMEVEKDVMKAICKSFGLPEMMPESVAVADRMAFEREEEALRNEDFVCRYEINPLPPQTAYEMFMRRFCEIP